MQTNIAVDDALIRQVLEKTGIETEHEAVEAGLRALLKVDGQKEVLKFFVTVQWEDNLDVMRQD